MATGFKTTARAAAVFLAIATVTLPQIAHGQTGDETSVGPVVVYLVRHAEKADDGTTDPPLTVAGQIRVQTLKAILADAHLTHVHSTDTERTRETARPIAEEAGLSVTSYDPRDLQGFADQILQTPGTHLVSGHSNTTPALVQALGGEPGSAIHDLEYDRLYIVVVPPGGAAVTTLLRFGEPYVAGHDFGLRNSPSTTPPWTPPPPPSSP